MKPRFLPIVYVIVMAILMYVAAFATSTLKVSFDTQGPIAMIVFSLGVLIVLISGYQFKMVSTTISPLKPEESTQLVTTGVYRFSRNPMYVGFLLFLLAWAVLLGSFVAVLVLPLFILIVTKVQILPEEVVLEEKFGQDYVDYKHRVGRWI